MDLPEAQEMFIDATLYWNRSAKMTNQIINSNHMTIVFGFFWVGWVGSGPVEPGSSAAYLQSDQTTHIRTS